MKGSDLIVGDAHLLQPAAGAQLQPPKGDMRPPPQIGTALPKAGSRFPKEWGDRSAHALAQLQSLHNMALLPYAKNLLPEATAYKRNGLNEIINNPPPPKSPGRYFTEGRTLSDVNSRLHLASATRAPFQKWALSLIGGIAGGAFLGKKHSVFIFSISGGTVTLSRTYNLRTASSEGTINVAVAASGITYYVFYLGPFYAKVVSPSNPNVYTIYEYELLQRSLYFPASNDNILPAVAYSDGATWTEASGVVGFDTYDHFTYRLIPVLPQAALALSAPVPRGTAYNLGARAATPDGVTPYVLFLITLDCGRSFTPIDMDYLFAGCTYEYDVPRVAGTTDVAGVGAYRQIFSITGMSLPENFFISFKAVIDAASAISVTGSLSEGIYEPRIFRSTGLNLTSMASIAPPSGHGTIYLAPLNCAFANSHPAGGPANFNAIGFQARAVSLDNPSVLFVSMDEGTTWQAPRYLPGTGRTSGTVTAISDRELGITVSEIYAGARRVVRYGSTDLGVTWAVRQIVSEDPRPVGGAEVMPDFGSIGILNPDDGGLPSNYPMGAWIMDSRAPIYFKYPGT